MVMGAPDTKECIATMQGKIGFTLLRELFSTLEYELEWTSVYFATFIGYPEPKGTKADVLSTQAQGYRYALGGMTSTEVTWVKEHTLTRAESLTADPSLFYLYVTSVHWALTQFTPAAMDVVASNTLERVFSVVICLAGLIAFSFFLGTINQSFAKLRSLTAQETRQTQLVRRYVGDKYVSADLSSEILACIRQRGLGKAMGKVVLSDIKVLQSLPQQLLRRLQEEVGFPVLEKHGMFKYLTYLSLADVARTCHTALTEQSAVYGEEAGGHHHVCGL
ncbi:KCNH6 [Symbiodinium pilosum]|uniref:KCNH6 protein n=1 Tax=Symbiodinium pilosum TaxID=2952 RepID=A0A812WZB3_SYMPI|nr:KCNH6 [Symbiodinium pilosum]